jgi:hypothetical protein
LESIRGDPILAVMAGKPDTKDEQPQQQDADQRESEICWSESSSIRLCISAECLMSLFAKVVTQSSMEKNHAEKKQLRAKKV